MLLSGHNREYDQVDKGSADLWYREVEMIGVVAQPGSSDRRWSPLNNRIAEVCHATTGNGEVDNMAAMDEEPGDEDTLVEDKILH